MRVITGSARGRRLKTPDNYDIRPTSDMVKEALFSIIQFDIQGASVLDLFSGSGQLGIEALSRGALKCVFVDKNKESAGITKENVEFTGFAEQSKVVQCDSISYLKTCGEVFDLAFLDPPYEKGLIGQAMVLLCERISNKGIAVCEHEKGLVLPDNYGDLIKYKNYRYGRIEVTVFKTERSE